MKKLIVLIVFIGLFLISNNAKSEEEIKDPWVKIIELAVFLDNLDDGSGAVKEVNGMFLIAKCGPDYMEFQVVNERKIRLGTIGFTVKQNWRRKPAEPKEYLILYFGTRGVMIEISEPQSDLLAQEFLRLWYQGQKIPEELIFPPSIEY